MSEEPEDTEVNAEQSEKDDKFHYRIRFLNYNMANSSRFAKSSDLPGHAGPGTFDRVLMDPFRDGRPLDLCFCSLVETRAAIQEWAEVQNKKEGQQLDMVLSIDAAKASAGSSGSTMRGLVEGLAVGYNGNLKTVLGFNSKKFAATKEGCLHGRLPETVVMGVPVPNPKKAFAGSSVCAIGHPEEFNFVFAGAHFPIEKISEMFEIHGANPLMGAKIAVAKVLRKILRRAVRRQLLDNSSMLVLQGDLNSRTVILDEGGSLVPYDLLKEVLKDRSLQAAIQQNLSLPSGTWQEMVNIDAEDLPVTYKYHEEVGSHYKAPESSPANFPMKQISGVDSFLQGKDVSHAVTIGDIMHCAREAQDSKKGIEEGCYYKRVMNAIPKQRLDEWGLVYKESNFRPFRFPAAADRIIYWAPLGLAQRVKWDGFYEVHHAQDGSDHRPVSVEALLTIEPPAEGGANFSFQYPGSSVDSSFLETPLPSSDVMHEVCDDDDKDSDVES